MNGWLPIFCRYFFFCLWPSMLTFQFFLVRPSMRKQTNWLCHYIHHKIMVLISSWSWSMDSWTGSGWLGRQRRWLAANVDAPFVCPSSMLCLHEKLSICANLRISGTGWFTQKKNMNVAGGMFLCVHNARITSAFIVMQLICSCTLLFFLE